MRKHVYRALGLAACILALVLLLWNPVVAQAPFHNSSHHSWPVGMETTTVTGTVIVDSSASHPMYFLDEGGDAVADYHLAFGPWWYQPASGATRPGAGETVTVTAAVHSIVHPPTLIVFSLDGLTWREPMEYGQRGWNGGPFWTEEGETFTVAGVVLVDTTYFYHHYYLDSDEDALPDYLLDFGPAWYAPVSGTARPEEGQTVTVTGLLHDRPGLDRVSVYQLDGVTWRSPGEPAPWAGGWMQRSHTDPTVVYCVNDTTNWIGFSAGHMGHGSGSRGWPDSTFVQFWQIHADSLPGPVHPGAFMGFYMNVHDPSGQSMMDGQFGQRHGMMRFEQEHQVRLHYYEEEMQARGLSEDGLMAQFWDDAVQQWMDLSGMHLDTEANTVTFSSRELSNHYALVAPSVVTHVEDTDPEGVATGMALHQNYPNPFSTATTITFDLSRGQHVRLSIYDVLGRPVATLVDALQPAGRHEVSFDGGDLPDGVYLYRLESGARVRTRTLTLLW